MASTNAIFTGLTGLNANSRSIDVIGNNVANVNTTAFKSSRVVFSTALSKTISEGQAPRDTMGGTNPFQVGKGVTVAGTQRNHTTGVTAGTGDGRDMAIDGSGFFIVQKGENQYYTRAGSFRQNATQELTSISGERLQGFGIDNNYNIVPGQLGALRIPVGELKIAEATSNVRFSGNLNAEGSLPVNGSLLTLGGSTTGGLRAISTAAPTPPDILLPTTRLIDIEDPALVGSDTPLFTQGQVLQLRNAEQGGKAIPTALLEISDTTTVDELTAFLSAALGIESSTGANPDGATPGVTLDSQTGQLSIVGNTGTVNDLTVDSNDLRLLSSTGDFVRAPFVMAKAATSTGESVRTSFLAFDSLGSEVQVDLSIVLESKDATGTTWRYYAQSPDDTDLATQLFTGTMRFDTDGQPINPSPATITIDRAGTGAASPLAIALDFAQSANGVTALASSRSELSATYRDGASLGTLASFNIARDGIITGAFTNGLSRTLGQVALATFNNPEGLSEAGGNLFSAAPNSGTAIVTTPGSFGTGELVSGALEGSNVDLGEEFTKMILASTGYSASSRVIRTADELLQQLLVLGR